ncbi:MAG TPA: hypothetical protein VES96_01890, partial [Nitrospiraceae bacterium]|nr:hypothetical protein [Nitrospiraceae bacterium]
MFSLVQNTGVSRVLILPWVIMWVLAIPLFHAHALDQQENHALARVVLLHTVFSPDLPGEYAAGVAVHQSETPENRPALSSHFLRYSEIAFGLAGEDSMERKAGAPHVLLLAWIDTSDRFQRESVLHVTSVRTPPPVLLL